uniref:Uncharacterized protein n=1 Tax=viral metagenome TaxID=1070528 RepID=A0A6M3LU99_9ZZZZ
MESIKSILMRRDNMTSEEADELLAEAREDFLWCLDNDESLEDFCYNWFGLEPDYLEEFLFL